MRHIRWILLFLLALPASAPAADVVYPTGSRIGLVPPPGLTVSRGFMGFEDRANAVAIVIAALPADAYGAIEKSTTDETLNKQGVTVESREQFPLPLGKAFLVIGRQQADALRLRKWILAASTPDLTVLVTVQIPEAAQASYPDAVVRAALTTLAVRAAVPVEEQLQLLPFRMGELAGFRVGGLLAGRAIMLTDGAPDAPVSNVDTHMVIAISVGGPSRPDERENFARNVFVTIPNLRDVRITTSEQLRIGGLQVHQILARGKDDESGADITIIQWLRFGGGAYLHVVGIARSEGWTPAYARFRQVRDGIEMR